MLRCREVVGLVGTGEWREAPLRVRLGLALHLMMCRNCRGYTRQIRAIGRWTGALYRAWPAQVEIERIVSRIRTAAEGQRS